MAPAQTVVLWYLPRETSSLRLHVVWSVCSCCYAAHRILPQAVALRRAAAAPRAGDGAAMFVGRVWVRCVEVARPSEARAVVRGPMWGPLQHRNSGRRRVCACVFVCRLGLMVFRRQHLRMCPRLSRLLLAICS
jgi:hypothetical protein